MEKVKYKVVAPVAVEGFRETYWQRVGMATSQPDGSIRMRIVALPLDNTGWDGTLVLFENGDNKSPHE